MQRHLHLGPPEAVQARAVPLVHVRGAPELPEGAPDVLLEGPGAPDQGAGAGETGAPDLHRPSEYRSIIMVVWH